MDRGPPANRALISADETLRSVGNAQPRSPRLRLCDSKGWTNPQSDPEMPDRLLDDPQYWRDQAKQARDPDHRRMMLGIAEGYERQSALLGLSRTVPLLSSGSEPCTATRSWQRLAQARPCAVRPARFLMTAP
jgi:hypothetical protein